MKTYDSEDKSEDLNSIFEMNKGLALHTQPKTKLEEVLFLKTVSELKEIAKSFSVPKAYKLVKAELVDALVDVLTSEENLINIIENFSTDEYKFFHDVYTHGSDEHLIPPTSYSTAHSLGLMQVFYCDDKLHYIIPDEIREVYKTIAKKDEPQVADENILLKDYAIAAINLYGIIPIEELIDIYNQHNNDNINLETASKILNDGADNFAIYDNYLAHIDIVNNPKIVEFILHMSKGKPRYIPSNELFLEYKAPGFEENTKYSDNLLEYLVYEKHVHPEYALKFVNEAILMASLDSPLQDYAEHSENYFEAFESDADIRKFMSIITDLSNNTRNWLNKGHTSLEISSSPRYKNKGKTIVKGAKIGRNEPCPCGSGKKYKRCCGR